MPTRSLNMSDTPQNDSVDSEIVEQQEVETNDSAVASDTTTPVEGESEQQVDEVAVAQEKANAAFNKQYGEKKQLERDLAAQREINDKFQADERERQAAAVGNIPPMPTDQFDDNYDAELKAHIDAKTAQAVYNSQNETYLQQQQATQFQQQQVAQQAAVKLQSDFVTNAKGAGATDKEFNDVISTLNSGDMTLETATGIMNLGADGYFIAKHLAANPQEANEFNNLSPMQQGMKLVELKQVASALKPKGTKAPAPADNLQGTTADFSDQQYKYINGSEIEVGAEW